MMKDPVSLATSGPNYSSNSGQIKEECPLWKYRLGECGSWWGKLEPAVRGQQIVAPITRGNWALFLHIHILYNLQYQLFFQDIYQKNVFVETCVAKKYKHISYCYSILALHMQSNHVVVILCLQFNFPPLKCNWVTLNHVHICTNVYNIHIPGILAISCINTQICEY